MSVFGAKKSDEPVVPHVSAEPQRIPSAPAHAPSLIGRSLYVKGDVVCEDDVVIDGKVEGSISVKNRLTVGKNAQIKADVKAGVAVIEGKVEGDVGCQNRIEITPGGSLHGNITSPKVVIVEGGFFEGNVDMRGGNAGKDAPAAEPRIPKK
jgi:cytoskeletal protein CcmA (bactofilin family)